LKAVKENDLPINRRQQKRGEEMREEKGRK
jgi:hypothetical protein